MPPLSSTKHVHGTVIVALKDGNGAFPPHCTEEFLPLNTQVTSPPAYSLHGLEFAFFNYNRWIQSRELGLWQHRADVGCPPCTAWDEPPWSRERAALDRTLAVTGTGVARTDRSEPEKQTLQMKRRTAPISPLPSAVKRGSSAVFKTLLPITYNSDRNLGHTWMEAG